MEKGYSIDPHNNFFRLFHSVRNRIEYSLVLIPHSDKSNIEIEYSKPSTEIDLGLRPKGNLYWEVEGIIDSDTFANLQLPISSKRIKRIPPVITDVNIQSARRHGDIEKIGVNRSNDPLFEVELKLPAGQIYKFLTNIWQPRGLEEYHHIYIPKINTNSSIRELVLPQKISRVGKSKILVNKFK